jgi:peptide/nickel transport system substrate-binding protein
MQKALAVGLSLLCFKIALLNGGVDTVVWEGTVWPTVGAYVDSSPTSPLKLAFGGRDVEEKTLKVGLPFLFTNQSPDPHKGGGLHLLQTGVAETLFKLGKDLRHEPWLATRARPLDEKTWEITVRQGVKFHNGALLDAAAVKASLERAITKSPVAKAVLDIARIEVNDPSTLTITTNNPSPILPGLLTDPNSVIADAAAADAMGDAFAEKPVLTGPFKVERLQQDKELVAGRHREYWGPSPLVGRAIFIYIPDNNSRVLALQSGDIDLAVYIAPESVPTVRSASNLAVVSAAPIALDFMYLNHRREVWKDVRVRQAIALATDREALVKGVMQGQGAAAAGPYPPVFLSCNQLQGHPFDVAKARQLLAQAGYQDNDGDGFVEKDGQTLAMTLLTYRQRPELPPMAEAIQGSLKTIGIKVHVRMVEQINATLQQGDWDGGMYFNNMVTTGDPYWALSQFFTTGGPANRGGFSSPRIDELARQVSRATDQQSREELACTASQAIVEEVAVVPLLYPSFNYGVSRKVVGFDAPHPLFFYIMDSMVGKQ